MLNPGAQLVRIKLAYKFVWPRRASFDSVCLNSRVILHLEVMTSGSVSKFLLSLFQGKTDITEAHIEGKLRVRSPISVRHLDYRVDLAKDHLLTKDRMIHHLKNQRPGVAKVLDVRHTF